MEAAFITPTLIMLATASSTVTLFPLTVQAMMAPASPAQAAPTMNARQASSTMNPLCTDAIQESRAIQRTFLRTFPRGSPSGWHQSIGRQDG
jgi:hypothetical protein